MISFLLMFGFVGAMASQKSVKSCQSYEECYSGCVQGQMSIQPQGFVGTVDCAHGLSDGVVSCAQIASLAGQSNYAFFATELSGHGSDRVDEELSSIKKYFQKKKKLNHKRWIEDQEKGYRQIRASVPHISSCFSTGCAALTYNVLKGKVKPSAMLMLSPAIALVGEGSTYTYAKCFAVSQPGAQPVMEKILGGLVFERQKDVSPAVRLASIDARSGCQVYRLTQENRELLQTPSEKLNIPIRIIAVKGDDVVDIKKGLKRLKQRFSDVQVTYLEGGGHSTPAVWGNGPRGDFLGYKDQLCAGESYLRGTNANKNAEVVAKVFQSLVR